MDFNLNDNKINNWLDDLERDRTKIFNEVKISKSTDKLQENKIRNLEAIQKQLLHFKKLLNDEKKNKDN